jgi:hypothetical protein
MRHRKEDAMNRARSTETATKWALALLALTVVGCEKTSGGAAPLNVAGTWTLVGVGLPTLSASLTHSGRNVAGTVSDDANYARTVSGSTEQPAGATTGSRSVTLVVSFSDGMVVTYRGDVSDDGNRMQGRYSTNLDTDDAWSATRR